MQTEPEPLTEETPRKRSRWKRLGRWLGVIALLPVLVVTVEHVRGRVVLKRAMAERGIRFPGPTERMDEDVGQGLKVTPRIAAALRLASVMDEFTSNAPPPVVTLRPAHALPLTAFDWWIVTERVGTNTWDLLLSRWDSKTGAMDRIRGLLGGVEAVDPVATGVAPRAGTLLRLGRLQRMHAMVGLRRGRPEAVLEALEGLRAIEGDVSGYSSFAIADEIRREQGRLRLMGLVGAPGEDGFLAKLMPGLEPVRFQEGWVEQEHRVRAEWVKELRNAPLDELPVGGESLWSAEFTDLTSDMDTGSGPGRLLESFLGLLDRVAGPAKEKVLLPIWRFGWGDLAIAELLVEGDREVARLRPVMAERSWRRFEEGEQGERGWYRRWLSPYAAGAGLGGIQQKVLGACVMQTEAGLSAAGIGLERYRLKHGEYPERLEQLVPEFLPAVPTDWFCGEPLRYRRDEARGFRLYGVGRNGVDDGGKGFGDSRAGVALFAGSRFSMQSLWAEDVVWPVRGTEEQRRKAMEEQEKRLKDLGSNPYGMDPALMRRYGLVPRTGGTGTFQMSPELARRYGLLPKGASTNAVPSTNAPAAGGK